MRKLIFVIPVLLIFARCSSHYKGEIAQLDSLITLLDSAKNVVHKLDSGLLFQRKRAVFHNLAVISSTTDTLSRDDVFLLDTYSSYLKAYNKWSSRLLALYEEVETIPMQLKNLKLDLSKNLIPKEQAEKYVKNESEMARLVIEAVFKLDRGFRDNNEPYIETEEKVLLLIKRLESQKQTES
ncbi:MAG TPA: hypothetical protein DCX54_07500 [Flavobacteriales bacterium]|nr:hypothetical protein [Flavobacteriales bacterium]